MYLLNSDGRSYCRLVAQVEMRGENSIETSYSLNTIRYYGDRTLGYNVGAGKPGVRTGWIPTASCLGIPANEADKPYPVPFEVHKPIHIAYVGREDYDKYHLPGSDFFGGNSDEVRFRKENQVFHLAYRGDVSDTDLGSSRLFKDDYDTHDYAYMYGQVPVLTYHGSLSGSPTPIQNWGRYAKRVGTNAKGNGIFSLEPISPYVFDYPNHDLLEEVRGLTLLYSTGGSLTYTVFGPYSARIDNFVDNGSYWTGNTTSINVEYDYNFIWNNTYTVRYHVHKKIVIGTIESYGLKEPNVPNVPNEGESGPFTVLDSSTVELVSENVPGGGPAVGLIPRMYYTKSSIDGDLMQYEADSVPNFVSYRFADRRYLNRRTDIHRSIFESLLSDIRPSAFLSSADALNKHLLALSTNHIQTLQKLSSVMDLLPELVKLPSIVKRLSNGDLGALKELIDYLSGEILRYRFTQAPAAKALKELIGSDVNAYLRTLTRKDDYIIYGNFEYEIPLAQNPYNDGRLLIVTRSKISISQDLSTLMEALLMGHSVGLLPTLSRIWEILPFSFVIDWFTGMNKRLKLVDTQLTYMAFRTNWCLNSFRLSYYPSDAALGDYNLRNVNSEKPFSVSAYLREKTVYMPRLRDSRFDFLATSGPNPLTAGALAWQLFT